jgi:hypothetical protein
MTTTEKLQKKPAMIAVAMAVIRCRAATGTARCSVFW